MVLLSSLATTNQHLQSLSLSQSSSLEQRVFTPGRVPPIPQPAQAFPWVEQLQTVVASIESGHLAPPFHHSRLLLLMREALLGRMPCVTNVLLEEPSTEAVAEDRVQVNGHTSPIPLCNRWLSLISCLGSRKVIRSSLAPRLTSASPILSVENNHQSLPSPETGFMSATGPASISRVSTTYHTPTAYRLSPSEIFAATSTGSSVAPNGTYADSAQHGGGKRSPVESLIESPPAYLQGLSFAHTVRSEDSPPMTSNKYETATAEDSSHLKAARSVSSGQGNGGTSSEWMTLSELKERSKRAALIRSLFEADQPSNSGPQPRDSPVPTSQSEQSLVSNKRTNGAMHHMSEHRETHTSSNQQYNHVGGNHTARKSDSTDVLVGNRHSVADMGARALVGRVRGQRLYECLVRLAAILSVCR